MIERMYRELGADTPLRDFADGRLRAYFADFKCYKVRGEKAGKKVRAEGKDVRRFEVERWTAQPPSSQAVEVATKAESVRIADELPGNWKHVRRGAYRIVPLNGRRPQCVTSAKAKTLEAEGWIIARRKTKVWMLVAPAAAQTRNEYRDVLAAAFDYALRKRWLDVNPLAEVKRASKREERERILRREDFYDPDEIDRLLAHAPGVSEEAFWLCGGHAGLRLPGEALGMKWGAVDFQAGVIRPYDNDSGTHAPYPPEHDQQYMAYAPRPELANQITRALDPHSLPENVVPLRPVSSNAAATFLERLEEEIPAKWLAEVRRLYAETKALQTASPAAPSRSVSPTA
jgi:hypothetical protein